MAETGQCGRPAIVAGRATVESFAPDGTAGFRTVTRMLTETVYVDRDLLCEQSENMFGRPDCGPVYKRSEVAGKDFTFVNSSKVFHFRVK